MAKRPELQIVNGALAGKQYPVGEGGLRLGRSSSNDIHIADEELSRNHCLFERSGEESISITDLASANGTLLNGAPLGNGPVVLKVGDKIVVGSTEIKVVGDEPPPAKVDLGLGAATAAPPPAKRSPIVGILILLLIVVAAAAMYFILTAPAPKTGDRLAAVTEEEPQLREFFYERVDADSQGIFRFELSLGEDGVLRVTVDDVPKEDRHLTKSQPLDEAARRELAEILAFKAVKDIDREYVGEETEPPKLQSHTLRIVYSSRYRRISIVNTQEPEAFVALREKLEAFAKNQLGVWALQYSRDKLVQLAENAIEVARTKWEDREVSRGNLFGAVQGYREALFYLETVNPKPDCATVAKQGLDQALAELDTRYQEQRFLADRAINLKEWDAAAQELRVLMELIPDRKDDRYREASAKLLDVEKRMKGGK